MKANRVGALIVSSVFLFGTILTVLLTALGGIGAVPVSAAQSSPSQASASWLSAGKFVDYYIDENSNITANMGAEGQFSFDYSIVGPMDILVNNITDNNANVTFDIENLTMTFSTSVLGITNSSAIKFTSSNGTETTVIPISLLTLNNMTSALDMLGGNESGLSSFMSLFSQNLNITINSTPGVLYNWNGNTVVALHLNSTISENTNISLGNLASGTSEAYDLKGTMDGYYSTLQDLPFYSSLQLAGNMTMNIDNVIVTGNSSVTCLYSLKNSNVDFGKGPAQESTINIPSYSSSLYVLSNSTIGNANTTSNELQLQVSGPSGTQGYADIIVNQQLLNKAGVTSPSQIQVLLDGQPYSNYTIFQVGGNYIIIIQYHHSSHQMDVQFGNANFGNNEGSIQTVGSSTSSSSSSSTSASTSPSSSSPSGTDLYLIATAIVVVVVVVLVGLFAMRRRRSAPASSVSPEASPPPAPPSSPS